MSAFSIDKLSSTPEELVISLSGRIDTTNARELEEAIAKLRGENSEATLTIDAAELEYVSSAGLRVFMRLRKELGKLAVINVSSDVYDIFETTGFTELLEVSRALREVSVEGCPVIGQGGNGTVYRIDDDTIVKVYKPWMSLEAIQQERDFARTAFVNGVPSVIAYDVVRVGDCLGVVFELIRSDTLGHVMRDDPENLEEYVDKYVALAKQLHSTHVPEGSFMGIQDVWRSRIPVLTQWCTPEEIAVITDIIDSIPSADTVVHNDLHPGNIMIQDGELLLIDMPELTTGRPIFDLVSVYRDMISAPSGDKKGHVEQSVGMPAEQILQAGKLFFAKYTGIEDPAEMEAYFKKIGLLYAFNVVMITASGSETATQLAPFLMDRLLRPIVLPNAQTIKYLFATM